MIFPGGTGGGGEEESAGFSFFTGLTPAVAIKGKYERIYIILKNGHLVYHHPLLDIFARDRFQS